MSRVDAQFPEVACVGAGTVGAAWACVFARAGCKVWLQDVSADALDRARTLIDDRLKMLGQPELRDRIQPTVDLSIALRTAQYVQESVPENLELKRRIFGELDRLARPDALIGSSTSSLPPSTYLDTPVDRTRCFVAHPINPPGLVPVVELCPSPWTSTAALDRAEALFRSVAMTPVRLRKEIKGFLLNRLQVAVIGEALHLIDQGYCTVADIDDAMTHGLARRWLFLGPLESGHLNSSGGYRDYMSKYGAVIRDMIESLDVNHVWSDGLLDRVADALEQKIAAADVPAAQADRDSKLLRLAQFLSAQGEH